ncbi:hypothetical protein MRX96_016252 [Rhipicephalus microplus]
MRDAPNADVKIRNTPSIPVGSRPSNTRDNDGLSQPQRLARSVFGASWFLFFRQAEKWERRQRETRSDGGRAGRRRFPRSGDRWYAEHLFTKARETSGSPESAAPPKATSDREQQ